MTAKATELARYALKGGDVTFDVRVKSSRKSDPPNKIDLEVSLEGTVLKAICDAETIGNSAWEDAQKLNPESLIRITGQIQPVAIDSQANGDVQANGNAQANGNGTHVNGDAVNGDAVSVNGHKRPSSNVTYVFNVTNLVVVAKSFPNLPSFKGGELSGPGLLKERLDNRILDQRAAACGAIFKLQSGMCQLIVEFLIANGFTWLHTPRIRGSHVAGDNEYFHLPYFGRDSWLTQHTQHSLQNAIAMDMQRVFDIGPVYRADVRSGSSARHLTEFTLLGINMTYEKDWHEAVDMIGSMLVFVFRELQERKQFATLIETVRKYYPSTRPFRIGLDEQGKVPRITWMEGKRMLREELGFHTSDKEDFTPEEEAALGRYFRESPHLGQTDLFTIEHFPLSMRQFNSVPVADAPEFSETWDFIAGGREICSGSHRISDHEELGKAMLSGITGPPMDPEGDQWRAWMNAFKLGMPPHAGASLGVNRIFQGFLGLDEIREATLFPRDANRLAP